MTPNTMSRPLCLGMIVVIAWGFVAGVIADEFSRGDRVPNSATKILHFPTDRVIGRLSAESRRDITSSPGSDAKDVDLDGDWEFVGLARGDVAVPANRNIKLTIHLGSGRDDLSCLAELGPSDLYKLRIESSGRSRPGLDSILHLTGLQALFFGNTGVTSRQLSSLKSLSSLRSLTLFHEMYIRSEGLAMLKTFPALERLDCYTDPTDVGVRHISQLPNLRWLRIRMGKIRGPGLAYLAELPRLEHLTLWGTAGLTDQHIRYLERLTRLKSLKLWGGDVPLTDTSLASISKLVALEELRFVRIKTDFTDAGIRQLANLPRLRSLGTSPQDVSVLAGMRQLESVSGIALTSRNMQVLARLGNLKSLRVKPKAPVGVSAGDAVAMLGELESLEKLHVDGAVRGKSFGDEELALLESLRRLKDLTVQFEGMTDRGLASIGKLGQLESLSLISQGGKDRLSKRGLNELNGLSQLRKLTLYTEGKTFVAGDRTPLNLSGLTNLRYLRATGVPLEESDLSFLAGTDQLENLYLQIGPFPETALGYIKGLSKLKTLKIVGLNCLDGRGLAQLGGLEKLESINFEGRITNVALGRLPMLPSLQMFDVTTDVAIRPETIARLRQVLPGVRDVNVKQPEEKRPATRTRQ